MLKVVEVGDVACEVRSLPVAPLFLLFDMQDEDLSTSDLSETLEGSQEPWLTPERGNYGVLHFLVGVES